MTVQEYVARATEKAAEDLVKVLMETPADRREWKPLDRGRTALDQAAECAALNASAADLVTARAWQERLIAENLTLRASLDTPEKAAAVLREGTAKLAAAIRATPDEALAAEITLPWMTTSMTLADFLLLPLWNMSYHEGQINYIHALAGPE